MSCTKLDVEDVHNVLSVMQKNLECPICLDLMKEPVTTRCDHIFCRFCMLQLLGKKKGRAQCPMCKKEVTKRSLQESPRFKLLVDGLMKIISAFELDSGYKFYPSQDYAKTCVESQKKAEQDVVQCTGYRNRSRKRTVNGEQCENHLNSLQEKDNGKTLTREEVTQNRGRPKSNKQDENKTKSKRKLITEFESDSSEDDLFKKAGGLGDGPCQLSNSEEGVEAGKNPDDNLRIQEANNPISLDLDSEDVMESDLAEYGFSERDIESTRSNLLCADDAKTLTEATTEKRSSKFRKKCILDADLSESGTGQQVDLIGNVTHCDQDARYEKDTIPHEMASGQSSPKDVSCTVPRKRMKGSIQRVKEWLLKTSEFLDDNSLHEELLSDAFPEADQDASDKASCMSDETEIMTAVPLNPGPTSAQKTGVNIEDQVFGKVYKREKRSNPVHKLTCIADVHVSGTELPKANDLPKPNVPSLKRKKKNSSGLQPEDFIKTIHANQENPNTNHSATKVGERLLEVDTNELDPNDQHLNNDKSERHDSCLVSIPDAQETKGKKQKCLKKKYDRNVQCLTLVKDSDISLDNQQSPVHSSEMRIESYPSSNEPKYVDNRRSIRRSRRLNLLPEKALSPNQTEAVKEVVPADPLSKTTLITEQLCNNCNASEDAEIQIATTFTPNGKVDPCVTNTETQPTYADDDCKATVKNGVNAEETEDSDLETQHLLKTFKSSKRMSFKLDPISETANKENYDPTKLPESNTNFPNGHPIGVAFTMIDKQESINGTSAIVSTSRILRKSNADGEAIQHETQIRNLSARKLPELLLRSTKKPEIDSEDFVESSPATLPAAGQLKDLNLVNKTQSHKNGNRETSTAASESKGLVLCSETESMSLYPVPSRQSQASAVRQGDTKLEPSEGENEQALNKCYQKNNFDEDKVKQITSVVLSQGSVVEELPGRSELHGINSVKSLEVYSDTPDGLLCIPDKSGGDPAFCAEAEKSFVFGNEKNLEASDKSISPVSGSQLITKKKRRAQKLESSEEESSDEESTEDEELPCFNKLFQQMANSASQRKTSNSSPKQQGGGLLTMFSSNSTSEKTQTDLNLPREAFLSSQESVNLFSSQSNASDQSANGNTHAEQVLKQAECQKQSSKKECDTICNNDQEQMDDDHYMEDNDYEDAPVEQNPDEVSGCESEASHTGDSSGLSSQCEILNTQQREAMRNNLEKLQREMAALEAVLEQHGTQSPASAREQQATTRPGTIGLQEPSQKQAGHGSNISPDAIPDTGAQSQRSVEQLEKCGTGSRSPTPPLSFPQTASRRETPEKVRVSLNIFKELKESVLTQEESHTMVHSPECSPPSKEPEACETSGAHLHQATISPSRSLTHLPEGHGTANRISTFGRAPLSLESTEPKQQSGQVNTRSIKRSSSPTFTSPTRTKSGSVLGKIPVIPNRSNFSLVASGLSQTEVILVQKFAKKTQSVFANQMSDSTTHVIMKTDEHLVCERTLKYFLGIAGRKWVVSFEWIVQSFREGRILDEYDFEVKGDVINGRNHRGPRRSRLGSDGLLLSDFEICCLGTFKDMTRESLEWMVSLCGASVVTKPQQFKHKQGNTSLVVVQPDGKTDYAAMRKRYRALVVTREWVLDSVASYKLQTFDSYLV
ncbi:breast cancer type 1 susceptibility protein isoform X4 [Hyperolius riggenbachi]|uniref:breast cancer type 1 susceptibility protein isoform X4 n=1 Tax=Hyperolius riggenbachi TaxID=752182 RepID=UPI0035A3AC8F